MTEIKNLMKKFVFVTVIICCVLTVAGGVLVVKQRTEYNMYLKDYSVVSISSREGKVDIRVNRDKYSFNTEPIFDAVKQGDYALFSPLGSSYYLFKTLNRLFG